MKKRYIALIVLAALIVIVFVQPVLVYSHRR